ncbi:ATP-binding cassette domain-containing protein [Actinoplanes sp. NPDC049599]|uniref:ABC transporter ATP-binding protein n=1 Tax=Actinoplanes sp. NPDC049599 TaxID=3363903 RepID=UPI0037AC2227
MTSQPVVEMRSVTKTFGSVKALDQLDLTVRPGEVAGFLGPNGAGKSTTVRVLLGLLRADSGQARVLGGDPWIDAVDLHRRIAYMPGEVTLWPGLTGGEAIDLLARLRGRADQAAKRRMLELFELDPTKKTRTYSKGNRQKVALVAALSSNAELLILDEPTSGLDPLMEAVFTRCIEEVKHQGRSVLLSSHILAEVEKLCDTVTIIRRGQVVQSGTLADLRHLTRSTIVATTQRDARALSGEPGVHDLTLDGDQLHFTVDNTSLPEVLSRLAGYGVVSLVSNPPSLEELFLREYGDQRENVPAAAR